MAEPDEKRLLAMARGGDTEALGVLLEGQRDRIFNVCLRMVSHRDDAAELTQETLLRVVERLDQFEGKSKLSTWMTRIAMNLSISHLRKRKVRRSASLDQPIGGVSAGHVIGGRGSGQAAGRGTSSGGTTSGGKGSGGGQAGALWSLLADTREQTPPQRVEVGDMVEHLNRALAGLDEEFRAVIVLRDIEQMDYQGMAEALDVPVGTVKSRLFRARLALREALQGLDAQVDGQAGGDASGKGADRG